MNLIENLLPFVGGFQYTSLHVGIHLLRLGIFKGHLPIHVTVFFLSLVYVVVKIKIQSNLNFDQYNVSQN